MTLLQSPGAHDAHPPHHAPVWQPAQRIAVVGAGMAGVACARALAQAGHAVVLFDKHHSAGGRMATRASDFGSFDHGAQFFTVTDARFQAALEATAVGYFAPWAVSPARLPSDLSTAPGSGRVGAIQTPSGTLEHTDKPLKQRFVGVPGMSALVRHWASALASGYAHAHCQFQCLVQRIEPDAGSNAAAHGSPRRRARWQLRCSSAHTPETVHAGFDQVLLALPAAQAQALLQHSALAAPWVAALAAVECAPSWTLMLAFAQTDQDTALPFGPDWNAAHCEHPRVRWLARENSKPGRGAVERWTVQASPEWSLEHLEDEPERVRDKLLRGFAVVSGICSAPQHAAVHRWRYALTQRPLGQPFLHDASAGLGVCGDWCLGNRVENAYLSGLELALAAA